MVCFWQATKFIFAAFARQKEASHLDFCRPQELLQTLYTLKWQASKNILSHHVHHVHIWHHLTNVTNMTDVISQHSTNTLIYHIRRNQMFHWPIAACIAPAVPWVPQHYTQKILKFQQKKNHILAFLLHTSPSENIVTNGSFNDRTYLQRHYGNGVFGNVYLSAGQTLPASHCRNGSCRYFRQWLRWQYEVGILICGQ